MAILVMKELVQSKNKDLDFDTTMNNIARSFVRDMDNPLGWMASFRAPGNCCSRYSNELKRKIEAKQTKPGWWNVSPAMWFRYARPPIWISFC